MPRNWIPKWKWNLKSQALRQPQYTVSEYSDSSWKLWTTHEVTEVQTHNKARKYITLTFQQLTHKSSKDSRESLPEGTPIGFKVSQVTREVSRGGSEPVENLQESLDQQWCDISEVIESDFLISPIDIYPNRKVQLEDPDIKKSTKASFEIFCEHQHETFSRNNKDIGHTQLIEMEINTGDSLPVAQSPYMLPLKNFDWVRQNIETLEKSGVIERSLSRWVSPVIVVPKKCAPDEQPWRRLCVDY